MKTSINVDLPTEVFVQEGNEDEALLVLHGYQQTGAWAFQRLRAVAEKQEKIISVNAPFPLPYKGKNGWVMTYGWYFFDSASGEYIIEMDFAVDYLKKVIAEYVRPGANIKVVGFSQGGYIAPFLAKDCDQVSQVIGLHCRFRSEVLTEQYNFRLDAIHGEDDSVVSPQRAEKCHQEIIEKGNTGDFCLLGGVGHEINDFVRREVVRLISIKPQEAVK